MAEIIKFDTSRKKSTEKTGKTGACLHKNVTVFTTPRTVRCAFCGALLDPFDVLLSMVQGDIPTGNGNNEERKLKRELQKRKRDARKRAEERWD